MNAICSVWDMLRLRFLGDSSVEILMHEGLEFRRPSVLRAMGMFVAIEAKGIVSK